MNLDSLKRRVERLEQNYVPAAVYGEMFIPAKYLGQLSEADRALVVVLSRRGVATDEGVTMQVTELSNEQIKAMHPIAKRLDEIKANERVN